MHKNAFCPISDRKVDTAVVRTHALINTAIILVFLFTLNIIPALVLLADFFVRVANFPRLSLVGIAARTLAPWLPIKSKAENAGPKLFAARIGLLFTIIIGVSLVLGNIPFALTAAGILGFFSLLEGAFGICVACLIYPLFYRLVYRTDLSQG
jgi:hypothetical protein